MSTIEEANVNRQKFMETKGNILSLLDKTIEYYTEEANENPDNKSANDNKVAFEKLKADLEDGEFSIVVVGEFSAGKSTLLNALMRKRILPSFSNETTATVNFLRHTEKAKNGEKGVVYYNDGRIENINDDSLETINKYVSTKGEDVANKVEHLDLFLDSDFLKDGVTLVDSPGLNGIKEGHREITEKQMLQSHASIYVFSCDHPGTATDFATIDELRKKVNTIIFVLNKADSIKKVEGETIEEVINSLKDSYKKQFPDATTIPEIWPVSSYEALVARSTEALEWKGKTNRTDEERSQLEEESNLEKFEDRLIKFLTCGEKTHQQLIAPVEKVINILKESKSQYEKEKEVLNSKIDSTEIDNEKAKIEETLEQLDGKITDSKRGIDSNIKEELKNVEDELKAKIEKIKERRLKEVEEIEDLDELENVVYGFEKNFKDDVASAVSSCDDDLRDRVMTMVKLHYNEEADKLEEKVSNDDTIIQIDLKKKLDVDQKVFEVGLEKMNEKTASLEEKVRKLEEEYENLDKDSIKAKNVQRNKEKLESKIRELEDSRDAIEMQILPPIREYTEEVRSKELKGGLFGMISTVLTGRKDVVHYERRIDKSEHDEAKAKNEQKILRKNEELDKLQKEIDNLSDVDLDLVEFEKIKKENELIKARKETEEQYKKDKEEINRKYEKQIRRLKRKLDDYCDDIVDEVLGQVKKELRNSKEHYSNLIINVVEGSLRDAIETKKDRLNQLEEQLKVSENDKQQKLQALDEKIEKINNILCDATVEYGKLDTMEIDKIENVEL